MGQHTSQRGWKKQQHDYVANLVSQFINERISVVMRKSLEMEAKPVPQEEQHCSHLSLPFDFKIQYLMSSKKSKAVPHEVTIKEDRESAHHFLLTTT